MYTVLLTGLFALFSQHSQAGSAIKQLRDSIVQQRAQDVSDKFETHGTVPVVTETLQYFTGSCSVVTSKNDKMGFNYSLFGMQKRNGKVWTNWTMSYNPGTIPTKNPYAGMSIQELAARYPVSDRNAELSDKSIYILLKKSPPLFYYVAADRDTPSKLYVQGSHLGMVYCELLQLK